MENVMRSILVSRSVWNAASSVESLSSIEKTHPASHSERSRMPSSRQAATIPVN